jgi:L-seryl-tRNA(Ser) seleniumtransferase
MPSIDAILRSEQALEIVQRLGAEATAQLARKTCEQLRVEVLASAETSVPEASNESLLAEALLRLKSLAEREQSSGISRVINATGVILHTNLGRAPLAASVRAAMAEAAGYCTVEYDLENGERGRRGRRAEELLAELTGAESGVVVNNGAAAALLVLTALSGGGEVVLSRGELVEIGGDFRIPDVMLRSGAKLDEVGTTNRTKLSDYAQAIKPATTMLMRVHPSNFRVVGFTTAPQLKELADLAHAHDLVLYEDAGSGALIDLVPYGLTGEPVIGDSIAAGADVVSFSGDKLLGGIQAGLIVGRASLIDRIRRHPLYRALRPDKTTLAAVEATLLIYRRGTAVVEIPALAMLAAELGSITSRAQDLVQRFAKGHSDLVIELIPGESAIGGGSAPTTHPPTTLIALSHPKFTADKLAAALRRHDPPVIARIADDRVLLDLRTVDPGEEGQLQLAMTSLPAS